MKQSEDKIVSVSVKLDGEAAKQFLDFKNSRFIKNTAEAARMLILAQLHQLNTTPVSDRSKSERGARELAA